MKAMLERKDLVQPELSYKIVGCAFEVFKILGPGLLEKNYQRALAEEFRKKNLKFKEQVPHGIIYHDIPIGRAYFDFLVEGKVVVELKRGKFYLQNELQQVLRYLKMGEHELGIILRFTPEGVSCKRVLNISQK